MRFGSATALLALAACGTLSYYDRVPIDGDTGAAVDTETDGPTDAGGGDDDDDDTTPLPGEEDCLSAGDEDDDGSADCDDDDCTDVCDGDGDGALAEAVGGPDCDDEDAAVNPSAFDDCDGADDDCDGTDDDGDADADGSSVCDDCDDADPSRAPGAVEACDGVDSDCDGVDCVDFYDGFETGGLSALWSTGGDVGWGTGSAGAFAGTWAATSGNIGNNQSSTLTLVLDWSAAGDVTFWHSGETEQGYDFLRFFVDGVFTAQWSGSWGWTEATYPVTAGVHTLEWRYVKDATVSVAPDLVAIDEVSATNGTP